MRICSRKRKPGHKNCEHDELSERQVRTTVDNPKSKSFLYEWEIFAVTAFETDLPFSLVSVLDVPRLSKLIIRLVGLEHKTNRDPI